jgi:hypothetical protein
MSPHNHPTSIESHCYRSSPSERLRESLVTVLVQLIQPGSWNVWAEDDRHVVQAVVESTEAPVAQLVRRDVDGRTVSVLVDAHGIELARSGEDPA